jgi:hypothetical protein
MIRGARILRPLVVVVAFAGLAFALYAEREGIQSYPWSVSWPRFVLAVLAFAFGPLLGALSFWLILRESATSASLGETAIVWGRSFFARYVPSGALTMVVRLEARQRLGASARQIWNATVLEQVVAALGGSAAAAAGFALARRQPPAATLALLVGTIVLLAVVLVASRGVRLRAATLAAVAGFASWAFTGAAAWILVAALVPSPPDAFFVAGAYAFAWVVVVFAPSGFGVREATLVAVLAGDLGVGPATWVAVCLRAANIVADVVAVCVIELATGLAARAI